MPQKQIIKPAKSAPAVGPYNHAVRVGDLLFCAGQIPIEPATGSLVTGDIQIQTDRVLQNVKAILDDQKLTFANVVATNVYLDDIDDFPRMNRVYAQYFPELFPTRTTIATVPPIERKPVNEDVFPGLEQISLVAVK
jgi:2-iminobutanoate/2-iminopropanoate deaminase